jgi:hypothetical protein
MTDRLKAKYDAVWFKGKGMFKLLDGDQICVYNPNLIFKYNKDLDRGTNDLIPGDRFVVKDTKISSEIVNVRKNEIKYRDLWSFVIGDSPYYLITKLKSAEIEIIKNTYYNDLYQVGMQFGDEIIGIKNRVTGVNGQPMPKEMAVKEYINYVLGSGLRVNFPSSLVGKILKKGERV